MGNVPALTKDQHFLKPSQVARLMGLHINTIQRYVRQGIVPHTKIHKDILIPISWVQTLIDDAENSVK